MRRAVSLREPLLVFAAALASYGATLYPTVAGGDSGELAAAACTAGIAHPPGYPLYTLLAHAFTWIPAGSPAWRVHLLSAVCGAGAAAAIAWTVARASQRRWAGVVAGLAFAWSPLVWAYATVAEVFALHNLLVAVLLAATLHWSEQPSPRSAAACALVSGLALANHHTSIFVVAPVLAWIGATTALRAPRDLAVVAAALAAGLSPYLWLILRTPSMDTWGDTRSLAGLLDLLLRREYGTFRLSDAAGPGVWSEQVRALAEAMAANLGIAGLAAAAIGVATWRSRFALVLAASGLLYVAVFGALANLPVDRPLFLGVTERFWQQPLLLLAIALGMGLAAADRMLAARSARMRPAAFAAGAAILVASASNAAALRKHRDVHHVADFATALLDPLPKDALLLVRGDLVSNSVRYLQACENRRPDVAVLDQELLTRRWYAARVRERWPDLLPPGAVYHPLRDDGFDIASLLERQAARAVHVYPGFKDGDDSWKGRFGLLPSAFAYRVVAAGAPSSDQFASVAAVSGFAPLLSAQWPDERQWDAKTWEAVVLSDFRNALSDRGKWLLDRASSPEELAAAEAALAQAAERWQPPPWHLAKNLGLAAMRLSEWEPSAKARAAAAWSRYLESAPPDEKDRDAIRRWIQAAQG